MKMLSVKSIVLIKIVGVVIVSYLLVYCILSATGDYRPMGVYSFYAGHMTETELWWAPSGFYDPTTSPPNSLAAHKGIIIGRWRGGAIRVFYPLWRLDMYTFHKSKSLKS